MSKSPKYLNDLSKAWKPSPEQFRKLVHFLRPKKALCPTLVCPSCGLALFHDISPEGELVCRSFMCKSAHPVKAWMDCADAYIQTQIDEIFGSEGF